MTDAMTEAPHPTHSSTPPPSLSAVAVATSAAIAVAAVAAALPPFTRTAIAPLLTGLEGSRMLVAQSLGTLAVSTAWDAVAGALIPAAAIILTAKQTQVPTRSLGALYLRLLLPYAVISVALQVGAIVIVPALIIAVATVLVCDPIARAERGESGFVAPAGPRAIALAALCFVWLLLATAWQVFGTFALADEPAAVEVAAGLVWHGVGVVGWLAWCTIVRRFPRP